MPIQAPQWTEYLNCPVCENGFEVIGRQPISLGCGHTVCRTCLANLQRAVCPFDQGRINVPLSKIPVNSALLLLVCGDLISLDELREKLDIEDADLKSKYVSCMTYVENLAETLKPSKRFPLSRPLQRKLVTLINCQLLEKEGRSRIVRAARSLGERSVTELILQHQNSQQLSSNLWAAVRARGCQFLGPAMQEEVLKLLLLALEDGTALSRKVLVMFVVQRIETDYPQASKTSIGHVVQLLYRASCFKVTKREGDSSLMQLKEEFRTYETLRREHDAQIVQIATDAGLRIAPDQWSSLLYGDTAHKSHMQSIIDKLQTPQSFSQSVQDLVIALQRTGDPGKLSDLRSDLDYLAAIDPSPEYSCSEWETVEKSLAAVARIVSGLQTFIEQSKARKMMEANIINGPRYKTSMCRDLKSRGTCPRGDACTFAHSWAEIERYRKTRGRADFVVNQGQGIHMNKMLFPQQRGASNGMLQIPPPIAQVAPVPRDPQISYLSQDSAATAINGQVSSPFTAYPYFRPSPLGPQDLIGPPAFMNQGFPMGANNLGMTMNAMQIPFNPQQPVFHKYQDDFTAVESTEANKQEICEKSLSDLQSRKEEIIDYLEDLVGKEETQKIKSRAEESSDIVNPQDSNQKDDQAYYSMWTSKSIATIGNDESKVSNQISTPTSTNDGKNSEPMFSKRKEQENVGKEENDQSSKYGPISRKSAYDANDPKKEALSVSQNVYLPPGSFYHQNGGYTPLQPIAVETKDGDLGYSVGKADSFASHSKPETSMSMLQKQFSEMDTCSALKSNQKAQLEKELQLIEIVIRDKERDHHL